MNLASLKTLVKRYGFDDSDPLADWINEALHTFEDAFEWPFLEVQTTVAIVATVETVSLPADLSKIISARFTDERFQLDYWGVRKFEDDNPDPTRAGTPTHYKIVGGTMTLWPIPDAAKTLRIIYRKSVADLTSDGASPSEIPAKYHYALVYGAASVALDAENEEDRASAAETKFQGKIDQATAFYTKKQLGSFGQVRDTQGYGVDASTNWATR